MRSGKEVRGASSNKEIVIKDDDEGEVDSKVDNGVKDKKDDKCGVEEKSTQEVPNKKGELKIDLRTLPFP